MNRIDRLMGIVTLLQSKKFSISIRTVYRDIKALNEINIPIGFEPYHQSTMTLIFEQLQKSLLNQLPMYAERIYLLIDTQYAAPFIKMLQSRLRNLEKETTKQRIEKLILQAKKLNVQTKN